jgi:hypothetical protein
MRPESMVVQETGARWPAWLGELADAARHVAVITQRPAESLAAFEQRAAERVATQASRRPPLTATLVCNRRQGKDALAVRRSLLVSLLGMMQAAGSGHVVLAGDDDERLANLAREFEATSWSASVRFRALDPVEQVSTVVRRVA